MKQLDKQAFIEAKAQGKNNTDAALQAGAISKTAAHKAGYRLSKDVDIQKRITKALNKTGVTLEKLLQVYTDAINAESMDRETGEITPNYNVRMKAADRLLNLSGIEHQLKNQNPMSQNITHQSSTELVHALKGGDEIELQRAVFRKGED
jgi:hypothetical protein